MTRPPKPTKVQDLRRSGESVYARAPSRVNLHYKRERRIPLVATVRGVVLVVAVGVFMFGSTAAPTHTGLLAGATLQEERTRLEEELARVEEEIDKYQQQVAAYQQQGASLETEVRRLNSKIGLLNQKIRAVNLNLRQLDQKIAETQTEIDATGESINLNKFALAGLINDIYVTEQAGLLEIFLKNPQLSDFFTDVNNISLLQGQLRVTIEDIMELKDRLEGQREQYALARADASTLRTYQKSQREEAEQVKQKKRELIDITKGQEEKYRGLVEERKQTKKEILNRLFTILGGGQMTFEQAFQFAKLASGATGVRPALLLAVLDRESKLGQNVGRCNYQSAMHPRRDIPVFLAITKKLGLDPDTTLASCSNADGVYGGAIGPAQFIPSTWAIYGGYEKKGDAWVYNAKKDKISEITGNRPSNPWNNGDAFVATSLFLRDSFNSRSCRDYGERNKHILPQTMLQERCAAAKYYAGGRWYRFRFAYGQAVLDKADQFEHDIAIISG